MDEREEVVYAALLEDEITLSEVIDVVIKSNGIIGVGLISLGDEVCKYIHDKI